MVKLSERFKFELKEIYTYISQDSKTRTNKFKTELIVKIKTLPTNPLKHRKSTAINDINARDLIFKGYVIPYLITQEDILILGIYKENIWK